MNRIAIFCGSSFGVNNIYKIEAQLLGETLANQNIEIVYGGADIGLMGAVANSALKEKGKVTGVLPNFLGSKEIAHKSLTKLILVNTMHERKTKMFELCDGMIALPGGFGMLDELFEVITWSQWSIHKKPVALLNTAGFFDELITFLKSTTEKGFLKKENLEKLIIDADITSLLKQMKVY